MKHNQIAFKIIALIFAFSHLLSLSSIMSFAASTQKSSLPLDSSSDTPFTQTVNVSKKELKLEFDSNRHAISEPIKINFDKAGIANYRFITSGVTVTERKSDSMEFDLTAIDVFGSVDVYAEYNNGTTTKSSLYTYKSGNIVYISDISKDRAWYNCMEDQYNQGVITKEEWDELYSDLSYTFIKETPTVSETPTLLSTSSSTTSITGTLRWELQDGTYLPLRQTKVELRDDETIGSVSISSTYTDNNGNFSFTFDDPDEWYNLENNGLDVFIRVYTEAKTFEVNQDLAFTYNYFDTPPESNVSFGSSSVFNYDILYDESNNVNKAVSVLQGMVVGERFATSKGMSTNNFIHVVYPSGVGFDNDSAFCWGDIFNNCFSVIGKDNFYDFDTLIHEYGHFVECSMGNYGASLWEIIINDPTHASHTDNFDQKNEKEYAMELTWSEAWATAFSQIAQTKYKDEYENIPDFANITDEENYEEYTHTENSCEAQEDAVIAFLWDLYDDGTELQEEEETEENQAPTTNTEAFDNISLGESLWWSCTTQSGTYTLTDFISLMDQQFPNMRSDIGALLESHQIAPGDLRITNMSAVTNGTANPRLTWTVNGSTEHPNNRFEVIFYDSNNNYIYSSPMIESTQEYNTTFTYTVPSGVWYEVVKRFYSVAHINIAVRGYQTDNPLSGPYMSKYATAIVTDFSTVNMHSSDPYIEKIVSIAKGSYCDMPLSFSTSGIKLLQTFGTFDTKMELYSSTGTLLASNDDGGYGANAFIRYDCQANTEYTIRLRFYSSTTAGTIKFAVTPAPWLLHSGSTALDTYEDIYTVSNRTSFNLSTTAAPNRTKVLTFKAPSDGSYTFELRSDFDTYIHVIDPRSGAPLVRDVDYNDDCCEGTNQLDAKLSVELDQNIPYLVIYSAFNPGSLTESLPMNVIITKN